VSHRSRTPGSVERATASADTDVVLPDHTGTRSGELAELGGALRARSPAALELTVAQETGTGSPAPVEGFGEVCELAIASVASWMAGGEPFANDRVAHDASALFGRLVGARDTPLSEMTRLCLRWFKWGST
jgi:hypothetical protein